MNLCLKSSIAEGCELSVLFRVVEILQRRRIRVIFTFHRVLPPEEMDLCYNHHLAITPRSFADFLAFATRQFHVVSLAELARAEMPSPQPLCAITFDDGWEDNHRHAFPVLKKAGVPATIFLCTGLIGTTGSIPEEALWRIHRAASVGGREAEFGQALAASLPGAPSDLDYNLAQRLIKRLPINQKEALLAGLSARFGAQGLARPSLMDWQQVAEMAAAGIAFGSHTVRHTILSVEDEPTARRELTDSLAELQRRVPQEDYSLAYPNGGFNERVMQIAAETGYLCACTTQEGFSAPGSARQGLPRLGVDNLVVNGPAGRFSSARVRLHVLRGGLLGASEALSYS